MWQAQQQLFTGSIRAKLLRSQAWKGASQARAPRLPDLSLFTLLSILVGSSSLVFQVSGLGVLEFLDPIDCWLFFSCFAFFSCLFSLCICCLFHVCVHVPSLLVFLAFWPSFNSTRLVIWHVSLGPSVLAVVGCPVSCVSVSCVWFSQCSLQKYEMEQVWDQNWGCLQP